MEPSLSKTNTPSNSQSMTGSLSIDPTITKTMSNSQSMTGSLSIDPTISQTISNSQSITISESKNITDSKTISESESIPITETISSSLSLSTSITKECPFDALRMAIGLYKDYYSAIRGTKKRNYNKGKGVGTRIYESALIKEGSNGVTGYGAVFSFETPVPFPLSLANETTYQPSEVDYPNITSLLCPIGDVTSSVANFDGLKAVFLPESPYSTIVLSNRIPLMDLNMSVIKVLKEGGTTITVHLRALPDYRIYIDESWDLFLPLDAAVGPLCVPVVLGMAEFRDSLELESAVDSKTGQMTYSVYVGSFTVEPDVRKLLEEVTSGVSVGVSVAAAVVSMITSTALSVGASEIQALGVFARLYSCTSPRVGQMFGSPRLMSPAYVPLSSDDLKSQYLGVLAGNLLLFMFVLVVQLVVVLVMKVACGGGWRAKDEKSEWHIFGAARFPAVTLALMFAVHTGSVFSSSKLLMLSLPDIAEDGLKFIVPGVLVVAFYLVLPAMILLLVWGFIPRSFFVYDRSKYFHRNPKVAKVLSNFLPVGAISSDTVAQSWGAIVSSYRRCSHHWSTRSLWLPMMVGSLGFASLEYYTEEGSPRNCMLWGWYMTVILVILAVYTILTFPLRHKWLIVVDIALMFALALMFGFTITWREVSYPRGTRVAQRPGDHLWPDYVVLALGWVVILLTLGRVVLAMVVWWFEKKLVASHPPMYKEWELVPRYYPVAPDKGDCAVLSEIYLQIDGRESTTSVSPRHGTDSGIFCDVYDEQFFDGILMTDIGNESNGEAPPVTESTRDANQQTN